MGWSNSTFQLLIVTASPSGFSGLFVYSPAPGPGNLIASVASQSGTDPYGNQYIGGVTSYSGTTRAGLFGASLLFNSSSHNVGQLSYVNFGTAAFYLQAFGGFSVLMADPISAVHPGSFPSPVPETWQDLSGTVAVGWTPVAAPSNPRVKLLAENTFAYVSGSGTHASFSVGANFINLPAAYTPVADRSISAYDNSGNPMGCIVRSTGVVEVFPIAATTAAVVGGMYPLD